MTTRLLVDIENGAGAKQGPGPIVTATNWQQTARLNRAGQFSFTMPATDSMAQYCRPRAYARCWHADGTGLHDVGYGRIERVEMRESEQGPLLDVSGTDLLGELADRIMRRTALRDEIEEHPSYVTIDGDDQPLEMYDNLVGDTTTYYTSQPGYFIVGSIHKFHKLTFTLGTNVNDSKTAAFTYLSGSSWNALSVTDGTVNLSQSGTITFDPSQFTWDVATGSILYKVKVTMNGGVDEDVDVSDISIHYYAPTSTAPALTLESAPVGWSLDAAEGYIESPKLPLSGTELVLNPGFEDNTGAGDATFTNWTNQIVDDAHVIADTTNMRSGAACLKLRADGAGGSSNYAVISQVFTVVSGTSYTLSFWTQGDGTHDGQWMIADNDLTSPEWRITGTLDTGVTAQVWTQVNFVFTVPTATTEIIVYLENPVEGGGAYALYDDVSLQVGGGGGIYLQCSGESVLEMLTRIADVTGENFILSPAGRKVLWLGKDERVMALRAVSNVDPVEVEDADSIALITEIAEIEDASEIVTRVYPYGSGMGASRITLANCNTATPTGYTVSTTDNYVQHDAAYAALGLIEIERSWNDIAAQTDDATLPAQSAANILMFQAVNWLSTHTATSTDRLTGDVPRFYELAITKCNQIILPGHKLRVVHHRWVDGYHAVAIDKDLWITAATWRVNTNGVATVGLEVATVPRAALNDALALATGIRRIIGIQSHNTAAGY